MPVCSTRAKVDGESLVLAYREYIAKHHRIPVENRKDPNSEGYKLATQVRKAKKNGSFTEAQLKELDALAAQCECPHGNSTVHSHARSGRKAADGVASRLMCEFRKHIAEYGTVPLEKRDSPGCKLARSIRTSRVRGVFSEAELAELDAQDVCKWPLQDGEGLMHEWRIYVRKYRSKPTEHPPRTTHGRLTSAVHDGHKLAMRIRKATTAGVFSAEQLAELESGIPAAAARSTRSTSAAPDSAASMDVMQTSLDAFWSADAVTGAATAGHATVQGDVYFEAQQGSWCGMHALNNYLGGPYVTADDCVRAARQVLKQYNGAESMENHLNTKTGWLSIDVMNLLGMANLSLHVEESSVSWDNFQEEEGGAAAMVNWNQKHWTVLQRDPLTKKWMHINSIKGRARRSDRRIDLLTDEVTGILSSIKREYRDAKLHRIVRTVGAEGRQYLETEGWRAMGPAYSVEDGDDAHCQEKLSPESLSLITLNVDGIGSYLKSAEDRMNAILDVFLCVQPLPDVLALQEMTAGMLAELQKRLPEWRICRRSAEAHCAYFNITAMRCGSDRTTSFAYPKSGSRRHIVSSRQSCWAIINTHAESGGNRDQRDMREEQLAHLSRLHDSEHLDDMVCLAVGMSSRTM